MKQNPRSLFLVILGSVLAGSCASNKPVGNQYSTDCKTWSNEVPTNESGTWFLKDGHTTTVWELSPHPSFLDVDNEGRAHFLALSPKRDSFIFLDNRSFDWHLYKDDRQTKGLDVMLKALTQVSADIGKSWIILLEPTGTKLLYPLKGTWKPPTKYNGLICAAHKGCSLSVHQTDAKKAPITIPIEKDRAIFLDASRVGIFSSAQRNPLFRLCQEIQTQAFRDRLDRLTQGYMKQCGAESAPQLLALEQRQQICKDLDTDLLPEFNRLDQAAKLSARHKRH